MKKLKNVLKGYMSIENIERLAIIDTKELEALYSGTLDDFQNAPDFMREFKEDLENKEVKKADMSCGCQLFIFV